MFVLNFIRFAKSLLYGSNCTRIWLLLVIHVSWNISAFIVLQDTVRLAVFERVLILSDTFWRKKNSWNLWNHQPWVLFSEGVEQILKVHFQDLFLNHQQWYVNVCQCSFLQYLFIFVYFLPVSQSDNMIRLCDCKLVTVLILCPLTSSYQRMHTVRPVNTNSLAFLVTGNVFDFIFSFPRLMFIVL